MIKETKIGFLGRMSKEKNLEILFEIIPKLNRKLENWKIVLAGPRKVRGEEVYEKKILKLIKKNSDFVKDYGKLDKVDKFLSDCDCLVLVSNNKLESFGIVQIEAMRLGTPCVASNMPGVSIPIRETGMGKLFEKNNATDLANSIVEVLKRGKKYYQNIGKNNLKKFDYQKSIQNYINLF